MFGVQADGVEVTTVEGLLTAAGLDPMQAAFKEHHGLQCGFCTPGMMLVGKRLIEENPAPSDDDVRNAIGGNICRCTGYMNIVKAIQAAAAAGAATPAADAALPANA
jgi:carbon-monoxide dehydrogenase small subunit